MPRHTAPKAAGVEGPDGLVPTLEAAFAGGGVHLVDAPIDYSENMRVLVDQLRTDAAARKESEHD
jgi:acetolactate synthase I/II/III large subunit